MLLLIFPSNFFLQVHALFCEWIKKNIENWSECVIVAPDEGGCKRCTTIANALNLDFALINNRNKGGEIKYYLVYEKIYKQLESYEKNY